MKAERKKWKIILKVVNLSHATVLFLYALKTSEKNKFSYVSRGYRKRPVVWYWLMSCQAWQYENMIDMCEWENMIDMCEWTAGDLQKCIYQNFIFLRILLNF